MRWPCMWSNIQTYLRHPTFRSRLPEDHLEYTTSLGHGPTSPEQGNESLASNYSQAEAYMLLLEQVSHDAIWTILLQKAETLRRFGGILHCKFQAGALTFLLMTHRDLPVWNKYTSLHQHTMGRIHGFRNSTQTSTGVADLALQHGLFWCSICKGLTERTPWSPGPGKNPV